MRQRATVGVLILLLGVILIGVLADPAWAQDDPDNSLDRITRLYRDNARAWETTLQRYALQLFWLLATIEFTFAALMLAFRGSDLNEWLETIVTQILFIGFFYWLLLHSSQFAGTIVESFQTAASSAAQASGVSMGMSPSDIFDIGLTLAGRFVSAASGWHPGAAVGLFLGAIVVIFCFALVTALLILALVESYVVISAGVLFLGFGGSRWTKDLAIKIMVYAVSVGAKLFVLQLLIALGAQVFQELEANAGTNSTTLFICIGSALVMLALTKIIPDMIQGLINGTSFGASGALGGAVAGAATGAAAGVTAGGMAVGAAVTLARAQNEQRAAQGEAPRGVFGQAARNLGGALVENVGHRLSGRAHFGHRFGQTAYAMERQAEQIRNPSPGQSQQGQGQQGQSQQGQGQQGQPQGGGTGGGGGNNP